MIPAKISRWTDACSKAIYESIMPTKRQIIMRRSQLEEMESEQPVRSFLLLQDEILGKQRELLQQIIW